MFGDLQPTPLQRDALAETIRQMSATDPAERDSAMTRLYSLGNAGVLAAMRLSPDVKAGLDLDAVEKVERFVKSNTAYADTTADTLSRDRDFLFDALTYREDPRVAEAARTQLKNFFGIDVPAKATPEQIEGFRASTPKTLLFK
ncbi:MAG: hypothetical protein QM770_02560 [Tepidisphaeraceae bacterium]